MKRMRKNTVPCFNISFTIGILMAKTYLNGGIPDIKKATPEGGL
jgi:hypothetical protein